MRNVRSGCYEVTAGSSWCLARGAHILSVAYSLANSKTYRLLNTVCHTFKHSSRINCSWYPAIIAQHCRWANNRWWLDPFSSGGLGVDMEFEGVFNSVKLKNLSPLEIFWRKDVAVYISEFSLQTMSLQVCSNFELQKSFQHFEFRSSKLLLNSEVLLDRQSELGRSGRTSNDF